MTGQNGNAANSKTQESVNNDDAELQSQIRGLNNIKEILDHSLQTSIDQNQKIIIKKLNKLIKVYNQTLVPAIISSGIGKSVRKLRRNYEEDGDYDSEIYKLCLEIERLWKILVQKYNLRIEEKEKNREKEQEEEKKKAKKPVKNEAEEPKISVKSEFTFADFDAEIEKNSSATTKKRKKSKKSSKNSETSVKLEAKTAATTENLMPKNSNKIVETTKTENLSEFDLFTVKAKKSKKSKKSSKEQKLQLKDSEHDSYKVIQEMAMAEKKARSQANDDVHEDKLKEFSNFEDENVGDDNDNGDENDVEDEKKSWNSDDDFDCFPNSENREPKIDQNLIPPPEIKSEIPVITNDTTTRLSSFKESSLQSLISMRQNKNKKLLSLTELASKLIKSQPGPCLVEINFPYHSEIFSLEEHVLPNIPQSISIEVLLKLEEKNPTLVNFTDNFWKRFVLKEFKIRGLESREECESHKELYFRLIEERNTRYSNFRDRKLKNIIEKKNDQSSLEGEGNRSSRLAFTGNNDYAPENNRVSRTAIEYANNIAGKNSSLSITSVNDRIKRASQQYKPATSVLPKMTSSKGSFGSIGQKKSSKRDLQSRGGLFRDAKRKFMASTHFLQGGGGGGSKKMKR